jgi:hypothetical protein
VNDQVSHPYKQTGKVIVLPILILVFLASQLKDKDSAPNGSKHFSELNLFLIFMNGTFLFVC